MCPEEAVLNVLNSYRSLERFFSNGFYINIMYSTLKSSVLPDCSKKLPDTKLGGWG